MKSTGRAIVIGASLGGITAITELLKALPSEFSFPIVIVQHIYSNDYWLQTLRSQCRLQVREAEEKEPVAPGFVYIAPANYHLMIEVDHTLSLSTDEKVNYSRPSIDVLFQTAADAWKEQVVGVLLTGSSTDGAKGLELIKRKGGLTIVQDPTTAKCGTMPESAIKLCQVDHVLTLENIAALLIQLHYGQAAAEISMNK
ncbi:MAG TPA: chemotaxis protein CheB [Cytophagales bacterium]|nr:chemotaxis protein CheB [Cytophagales bacterium]